MRKYKRPLIGLKEQFIKDLLRRSRRWRKNIYIILGLTPRKIRREWIFSFILMKSLKYRPKRLIVLKLKRNNFLRRTKGIIFPRKILIKIS